MKRILFPTDFSEVATNAFSYALDFASLVGGEIIVLHSYDLIPMDSQFFPENFNELYDSVELANYEQFNKEIPKLHSIMKENHFDHLKMSHRLMEGNLFSNINKSIDENAIDFIVMGTSNETDWESLFAGSNSGSVILNLKVPMICIPMGVPFKPIKTIGFINHFTSNDKKTLYALLDIAKNTNAKIKCLYVKTKNADQASDTIENWKSEFEQMPIRFYEVQSDAISEEELLFISNENIDILAMLTYKSSLFEAMFVPNYSKSKTAETHIPFLVIHA